MTYQESQAVVQGVESQIVSAVLNRVSIPGYLSFRQGPIGGLFLEYCSNPATRLTQLNSRVRFSIFIDVVVDQCTYFCDGQHVTMEMSNSRNLPSRFTGFKKPVTPDKVVNRLVTWLENNYQYLLASKES